MGRLSLWSDPSMPRSLMDEAWNIADNFDSWLTPTRYQQGKRSDVFSAACDIRETKDEFLLNFDIPGVDRNDVHIELTGNQLSISGERKLEDEYNETNTHRVERSYGKFSRTFTLPEGIDSKNIEANFENGVLTITVPKAEVKKPRKISIGSSQKGFLKKLSHKEAEQVANS